MPQPTDTHTRPYASIAARLFRVSFQYYVAIAVALTGLLAVGEYVSARAALRHEMTTYEHAFGGALAEALWTMDITKLDAVATGIVEIPDIAGIRVFDPANNHLFVIALPGGDIRHDKPAGEAWAALAEAAAVRHVFDISYKHATGTTVVGRAELLSSRAQLLDRIKNQTALIFAISLFKEAVLWGIFLLVSRRFLIQPLRHLIQSLGAAQPGRLERIASPPDIERDIAGTDLMVVRDTFNGLIARVETQRTQLLDANSRLEEQVAERTRALEDANRHLQATNTELEQFAYVASHDLRQPLRMVNSYLGLLERRYEGELDEEAQSFIGFARDGAARMDRLIRDLLSLSRIGRTGRPFEAVPFADVVADALAPLAEELDAAGATVSVSPDLPQVWGDSDELTRLMANLIGNAVKYRAADRACAITIGWRPGTAGELVFWVRDNGIGIAAEHFARIFQIFQRLQVDGPTEGTGIGLSICKKIVERHGGKIWLESAEGQGSAFSFTLAAAATATSHRALEEVE